MRRVVITGMGAITPIGNNVKDFWNNLILGKSGSAPILRFDTSAYKTKFACEVKNYDPLQFFEKSEIRKMDLFTQYALVSVDESIKDSLLNLEKCDKNKIGVVWGSGMGGIQTFEDELYAFFENKKIPRFNPFFITKLIPNIAAGQISIKYGFHGPSYVIASACTSSNTAIADAYNLIRAGISDIIITGGSEAPITQGTIGGFSAMRALSESNDFPEKASRPFDKTRNGFVLGEGAGALVIEELEHAIKRNAQIYCELLGCGLASDGYHVAASHPEGLGAILAMEQIMNLNNILPEDVNYINAHATSTTIGDISECKAICKLFEKNISNLQISATKSMTGHLLGAAGVAEAIATILAIKYNKIPPTINLNEIDQEIDQRLNLTPNKSLDFEVRIALNNTFGFGGHIVSSLFKKFEN